MFAHEATVTGGDDIELLRDCDMVIITAVLARSRPARLELAGANVAILEKLLPNILSVAPNAIIMLVTNPVTFSPLWLRRLPACPQTACCPPVPFLTPPACVG